VPVARSVQPLAFHGRARTTSCGQSEDVADLLVEPLLAREVQQRLLRLFSDDCVPTVAEIRAALRDGPEFVQPERYRWQFGREDGPWRGRYREPAR